MMKFIVLILLMGSLFSQALEIDEKLTLRIMKTSSTGRTILINRGIEDGLEEGDHAKFFVSEGVVARGVLVKLSPGRSVWSIYRLVDPSALAQDEVLSLKISTPVKITNDQTRQIVKTDVETRVETRDPRKLGIPIEQGGEDLPSEAFEDDPDLVAMDSEEGFDIGEKNIEIWISIYASVESAKTSSPNIDFSASQSVYHLNLGGEYYFKNQDAWYSNFSFSPFLSIGTKSSLAFQGTYVESSRLEFGLNAHWYPFKSKPWMAHRFIPYILGSISMGNVSDKFNSGILGTSTTSTSSESETLEGSSRRLSLGVGVKFYTAKGFGMRAIFDYFMLSDSFDQDIRGDNWDRSSSGPRIQVGFSYRW